MGGIILTLYYFTPCHFIICKSLSEFFSECIGWIRNKNNEWYYIMISIFLYVVIIFFSFIYNEVIIINLCSLEANTFKYISFREKLEFENLQNNYEENLSSTSSFSSFDEVEGKEEEKEKEK